MNGMPAGDCGALVPAHPFISEQGGEEAAGLLMFSGSAPAWPAEQQPRQLTPINANYHLLQSWGRILLFFFPKNKNRAAKTPRACLSAPASGCVFCLLEEVFFPPLFSPLSGRFFALVCCSPPPEPALGLEQQQQQQEEVGLREGVLT